MSEPPDLLQCPWDGWAPATMHFCEKPLCAWITTPASTWSNLAFVFVGVYILHLCRKQDQRALSLLGTSAILLGLASGLFHASSTAAFQILDLVGMFFISGLMITYNIRRWLRWSTAKLNLFYWSLVGASAVVEYFDPLIGVPVFAVQIAAALTIELVLHIRDFGNVDYGYLFGFVGAFVVSFTIWVLDVQGIVCDPDNHWISGHAIWHVLNGFAILFLYLFHAQFKTKLALEAGAA